MKWLKTPVFILIVIFCAAFFFSCGDVNLKELLKVHDYKSQEPQKGTFEGLSLELENRIKQDYFDTFVLPQLHQESNPDVYNYFFSLGKNGVNIKQFYGIYNDKIFVLLCDAYNVCSPALSTHVIGEIRINNVINLRAPARNRFMFWNEGWYNSNNIEISQKDLLKIFNIHNTTDVSFNACQNSYCNFTPKPLNPEYLSEGTEFTILQEYIRFYNITNDFRYGWIWRYYGTYNDSIVVYITSFMSLRPPLSNSYTVAGIVFSYTNDILIQVWSNGRFYNLRNAYNSRHLTREDLMNISYYHFRARTN